jgi:hypothetical protein
MIAAGKQRRSADAVFATSPHENAR